MNTQLNNKNNNNNPCGFETSTLSPDEANKDFFVASSDSLAKSNRREAKKRRKLYQHDFLRWLKKRLIEENIFKLLVVLGSFIVYFIADGCSLSFGIYTRELVDYFGRSENEHIVFFTTSLIQAIPLFLSPLVCFLIKIYSCRTVALLGSILFFLSFVLIRFAVDSLTTLNLVMGFMTSIGLAMLYIPAYLIISFHFNERRALATGIAVSGSGLGLMAISFLSEHLITEYGWHGALLILGAIGSHTFISALLFGLNDADAKSESENTPKVVESSRKLRLATKTRKSLVHNICQQLSHIYRTKNFLLITLSYVILSFSIIAPHNFLPLYIKSKPGLEDPSSISISLIGFSTLVGQISIGFISDLFRSLNWFIYAVCLTFAGVFTFFLPYVTNIYVVYAYSLLFGFLTSVNYVLQSTLVIESGLGGENLTMAFGCLQWTQGFSVLLGTPVLSLIKDLTKDYNLTFNISGFLIAVAGLLFIGWPIFHKPVVSAEDKADEYIVNQINENCKNNSRENMRLTISTEIVN